MTKIIKITISFVLLTAVAIISIAGWLSSQNIEEETTVIGKVDVSVDVCYLYDDGSNPNADCYDGNPYHIGTNGTQSFTKVGVYNVNLSSETAPLFISNLRVNIQVKSNIDTYFRIAVYEQLTLTYTSGGKTYEVATTQEEKMPFNYYVGTEENPIFYDNRDNDGFFYFTSIVQREDEVTSLSIPFIGTFDTSKFSIYDNKYSLQLGFIIEAVQAIEGPQNNWGLLTRPWDDQEW